VARALSTAIRCGSPPNARARWSRPFVSAGRDHRFPLNPPLQKLRQLGVLMVIRLASSRVSKSGNGSSARFILVKTDIGVFEGGIFRAVQLGQGAKWERRPRIGHRREEHSFQDVNLKTE
jgi:hypothetical protein